MGFKKVSFSPYLLHGAELICDEFYYAHRMCSKQEDYQEQYLSDTNISSIHQKEELDAAEALTFLAGNFKSRWIK